MTRNKPLFAGTGAAIGLLILYFGILGLSESFSDTLYQFGEIWYWVFLLVAGFGTQVALLVYIRGAVHSKTAGATAGVAASGGVSMLAMIACCAHHVTDVLPILGLSVAAVFLADYQLPFILLGVFSNLAGITIMLGIIQKCELYPKTAALRRVFAFDMKKALNAVVVSGVIIVAFTFLATAANAAEKSPAPTQIADAFALPEKVNTENRVTIKVKPINFEYNKPVKFSVSLNTHKGSLKFDLTRISVLEDDKGNMYRPTGWEGAPPGGHHRKGTLSFAEIGADTKFIKLTIRDVYDVPERVFEWVLRR